jgi:hypothetical protein
LPSDSGGHPAITFSSRHIRGTKFIMTGIALSATAGVTALFYFGQWIPGLFVGLFDLIFLLIAYSIWTGDTEVEVQPTEVVVRSKKLGGWKEQRLRRDQIARVSTEKSMSSGERQFFKLVLLGQTGADVTPSTGDEPFLLRKIRYQLARARTNPSSPTGGQGTAELLASLRTVPRFQVTAANNVPGPALAESVARMLEQRIGIRS